MKMNYRLVLGMFMAGVLLFVSCKKDNDPPPATIVGFWKGKYGSPTSYPTSGYAMLFRNNGTIRVFNSTDTVSASKAEGTYSLTGSAVTIHYTYLGGTETYSAAGTMDTKCTFIEGTWGAGTSTTDGGRYFVNKQ